MNVTLITGATSGIGKAFAENYAAKGHHLFISGRRQDVLSSMKAQLEKEYAIHVYTHAVDLGLPEGPKELYEVVQQAQLTVDILINNAGFGSYGLFEESSLKDDLDMIDLNNRALVELTHLFLKDMLKRQKGAILNVASIAAFFPGPLMAEYYASKAFVLSFSRALKEEVKDKGVVVSCLCPGPTQTGFAQRAKASQSFVFGHNVMSTSDKVAKYGIKLLEHRRAYGVEGWLNKTAVFLMHLLPSPLNTRIVYKMQSAKNKDE